MANKAADASKPPVAPPGSQLSFDDQLERLDFSGDAIDAALRKLLALVQLPKEAQQIDRAMQDFASRYHECNPELMQNPDAIYAIAFSILLLHTDAHNKNVRHKMNKDTFIAHTKLIDGSEDIPNEILDIMYDNIVSTEFTYADQSSDDDEVNKTSWLGRLVWNESTTSVVGSSSNNNTSLYSNDDLVSRLTQLMPDTNTCHYTRRDINIKEIHMAFQDIRHLYLSGVRSRQQHQRLLWSHGGGSSDDSNDQSMYRVRVVKAAVMERKYDLLPGGKRTSTRGWRSFGVALTGSQIVFFSDTAAFSAWLENDDDDDDQQQLQLTPTKTTSNRSYLPFLHPSVSTTTISTNAVSFTSTFMGPSPSLPAAASNHAILRPVQIISLENAVCVYDEAYTKYPHVMRLLTGDGQQFLFKAKDDDDLDDWMAKINYVATAKTKGVRLRPINENHLEKIRVTIESLDEHMVELQRSIDKDLMLRRNLLVLEPMQRSTRERMVSYAETLGRQLRQKWSVMQQLLCYHAFCKMALAHPTLTGRRFDRSATAPILFNNHHHHHPEEEDNDQQQQQRLAVLDNNHNPSLERRLSCPPFPFEIDENHRGSTTTTAQTLHVPSSSLVDRRNRSNSNPSYDHKELKSRGRSGSAVSSSSVNDEISLENDEQEGSDTHHTALKIHMTGHA